MELLRFDNFLGEGIVSFLPCLTLGPELDADRERWYHHMLVSGERVFEYGSPCGTCGIHFRKLRSPSDRLNDQQAAELLGSLEELPPTEALTALGRVLEPTIFHPLILQGLVERVSPGSVRDYFASDAVRLFGLEPPEYRRPLDPGTAYYRFSDTGTLPRTGRRGGPHQALVTTALMPLHDPDALDWKRVEYWKARHREGLPLTAFAVSVIDNQAPAMQPADMDYPFEEHFFFANFILDGHHRVQAAAELGAAVRVLSFLAPGVSLAADADLPAVVGRYVP